MDGAFACPECGCEIHLKGLSPGREVRCEWCRTWVEVPYIPRADQIKSLRRTRFPTGRWQWPVWAWPIVAVLVVAITFAVGRLIVRSQWQKAENEAVAKLVESSREAETSGRLGEALAEMEGALAQALSQNPHPAGLDELRHRRDSLSRREAESQLAALNDLERVGDPGNAVGRALTLLARAAKDEALEGLEPQIHATLERHRLRWVEADARSAEMADEAGQAANALELCQRQYTTAGELPQPLRETWQIRAGTLAQKVIHEHGTIVEPVHGQFTLGTPNKYGSLIDQMLIAALRQAGYLPRPPNALWDEHWSSLAPYHVAFEIHEHQDETYLESQNRVSNIDSKLSLLRQGEAIWREGPNAHTQVPLPGLPAYQASRVAVSDRRSPEFERLLYENARDNLLQQLGATLHKIPAARPIAG